MAESVLIVTERILQEASTQRGVLVRTTSQEVRKGKGIIHFVREKNYKIYFLSSELC